MKRSPLVRKTRLHRISGRLRRRMKDVKIGGVGFSPAVGPCERCGRVAYRHEHHLILRSQGGIDGPTVWVCGLCHTEIHNNPNEATRQGWIIRRKSA